MLWNERSPVSAVDRESNTVVRVCLVALLWLIFAWTQVNQSARWGQLSLPITYDDNVYFDDALTRLDVLYEEGAAGLLRNLWEHPPRRRAELA